VVLGSSAEGLSALLGRSHRAQGRGDGGPHTGYSPSRAPTIRGPTSNRAKLARLQTLSLPPWGCGTASGLQMLMLDSLAVIRTLAARTVGADLHKRRVAQRFHAVC
jgi:hypothetical protein